MASGPNVSANLSEAYRLIKDSVKAGAQLVSLPENFAHMGMKDKEILSIAEDPDGKGEIQSFLSRTAKEFSIWLLGGTTPLNCKGCEAEGKVRSAALLYNDKGELAARYDKIHLFDVDLSEDSGAYKESAIFEGGREAVVVETPFGNIGIAICYDIRFPELFRRMEKKGMEILMLPSSFTAITGKAHWEVLNRARAIENLCFVVSSAQGGYHVNGRETHGDSMIVDPWGQVIDHLPRGSGYVIADIDVSRLHETRQKFPVLEHRRLFCHSPDIQ